MTIKRPPIQENMVNKINKAPSVWVRWFSSIRQALNFFTFDFSTGNLGVGVETPTAWIHLKAGTTTTPPLKLTEGDSNTTPQAGAMEYTDGHLFFSKADEVRYAVTLSNGVKSDTTTVTNTTTETEIYSKSFAANELHADEIVNCFCSGVYSNASASDDFTIRFKIDGVEIHALSRLGGNKTNAGWLAQAQWTIRTTGSGGTYVDFFSYTEDGNNPYMAADTSTHSIDTTTTHTVTVTIEWDSAKAGNIFSCTQGYITFNH